MKDALADLEYAAADDEIRRERKRKKRETKWKILPFASLATKQS